MDPRRAAHTLSRISGLLELSGVDRFRARAYRGAADAIRGLPVDDITPLYRAGELEKLPGVGPATLSVIGELVETGESSYLEQLLQSVPEGLLEVAHVPGLTPARAALLHEAIGVTSLDELEAAALDGRLRTVRGFGDKTVRRVLRGIEVARGRSGSMLYRAAAEESERAAGQLAMHPDIRRIEPAGEVRRIADVVRDIVLVAQCAAPPERVCEELKNGSGVIEAGDRGGATYLRFVDDTEVLVACTDTQGFPMAMWRATGSGAHVGAVETRAASLGVSLRRDGIRTADGATRRIESEHELYEALGMDYVPPELREGTGEVEAATRHALPALLTRDDLRGVLHCHSEYSDGSVSIAEMAAAARDRGWSYLGISDHSQAAFYAGGLKPDAVARQHDEIDDLNARATDGFRILKGIECDILADGQLDYDEAVRDTFDYVIGSIHSRFSMELETMTARILRAMDDPHLTILAHPTGRLLLQREPYAVDLDAVIEKAAETGVCVELNADPSRLDLDWRWCRKAKERGARIEIGPDAHSPRGLDHMWFGAMLARKAWLSAADVLNTRTADEVLALVQARRERGQ